MDQVNPRATKPSMNHHGHMDHAMPGMDDSPMMMMMQWNWATRHFTVVFSWWHVMTALDFGITVLAVFLLSLLYERVQAERSRIEEIAQIESGKTSNRHRHRQHRQHRQHQHLSTEHQSLSDSSPLSSIHNEPLLAGSVHDNPNLSSLPSHFQDTTTTTFMMNNHNNHNVTVRSRIGALTQKQFYYRTALMAISYSLSIFLMLIFMTYNGWIIIAAIAGAATGFHQFRIPGSQFGLDKSCCD